MCHCSLHKCDHVKFLWGGGEGGGGVVRLTAKPRYLLLLQHGTKKSHTVTALRETHAFQPVHALSRHTLYFSRWEVPLYRIDEAQACRGEFSVKFIAVLRINATYQPISEIIICLCKLRWSCYNHIRIRNMDAHGMREAVKSLVVKVFCAVEAVVALRSRSRCHLYLLNPFIFLSIFILWFLDKITCLWSKIVRADVGEYSQISVK